MPRRRRSIEVFTLSFLDCICCGFGAVILFYTIVSAQAGMVRLQRTDDMGGEVNRLAGEVLEGQRQLAVVRTAVERTRAVTQSTASHSALLAAELENRGRDVSTYDEETLARREHIDELKSDIRALEEGIRRLEDGSIDKGPAGQQLASFREAGGERQYITGLRLHGSRILILLDESASMLHEDLVTVIRMRNFDDARKRAAAKWRRAVETVEWLRTQLPPGSQYQIYTFNTQAQPLLAGTGGRWLQDGDAAQLARELAALNQIVPRNGTSLYNAFAAVRTLSPLPDQIVLITDGLPTQGKTPGSRRYVDSGARMRLFDESVGQLPEKVPLDTLLLPMNGDPQAAHRFWRLARLTGGTLLMPAKDWP